MAHLIYHAGKAGKANRANAKGLTRHTQRKTKGTKNHSNEDINPELTKYNLDLLWGGKTADERIEERLENEYKGKRALRKDHVVLREVITQPSPEVFEGMTIEQKQEKLRKFIKDSMPWFMKEFGKENVVGASGHLDETNPHVHYMIMPMTKDGRVSQTEFFTGPKDLQRQHKEFRQHMIDKGWDFEMENKYAMTLDDVPNLKFKANGKEITRKRMEQDKAIRELSETPDMRQEALQMAYDSVIDGVLLNERKKLKEREERLERRQRRLEKKEQKLESIKGATQAVFSEVLKYSTAKYDQKLRKEMLEKGIENVDTKSLVQALDYSISDAVIDKQGIYLQNDVQKATKKATPKRPQAPIIQEVEQDGPEL